MINSYTKTITTQQQQPPPPLPHQLQLGLSRPIRDPIYPEDPIGDRSETSQPDYSSGRRRVSASRTRKRRVGWRVFSPKPEETQSNRDLNISRQSYLHPVRSQPFLARSQHFPMKLFTSGEISTISGEISARSMESSLDLARSHYIWRDLAESDEISTNSKKIQRKYHRNFVDFAVKLPDFGRFSDLQLRPNRPPSVEGPISPI